MSIIVIFLFGVLRTLSSRDVDSILQPDFVPLNLSYIDVCALAHVASAHFLILGGTIRSFQRGHLQCPGIFAAGGPVYTARQGVSSIPPSYIAPHVSAFNCLLVTVQMSLDGWFPGMLGRRSWRQERYVCCA